MERLSRIEFDQMIANSKVLKKDTWGIKIILTPDNKAIKLFRLKRLLSSGLWQPYALRFARNATLLRNNNIRTVSIERVFTVPEIAREGVLYTKVEGQTLRSLLQAPIDDEHRDTLMQNLAIFLAELHEKGILFRSSHFGNLLVTSTGEYALIDIADLTVRRWGSLTVRQRVRNFRHLTRHATDRRWIKAFPQKRFLNIYSEYTYWQGQSRRLFEKRVKKVLLP